MYNNFFFKTTKRFSNWIALLLSHKRNGNFFLFVSPYTEHSSANTKSDSWFFYCISNESYGGTAFAFTTTTHNILKMSSFQTCRHCFYYTFIRCVSQHFSHKVIALNFESYIFFFPAVGSMQTSCRMWFNLFINFKFSWCGFMCNRLNGGQNLWSIILSCLFICLSCDFNGKKNRNWLIYRSNLFNFGFFGKNNGYFDSDKTPVIFNTAVEKNNKLK